MSSESPETTLPACPFCGHEADGRGRAYGEDTVWHTLPSEQHCRIAGIAFTLSEWSRRSVGVDAAAVTRAFMEETFGPAAESDDADSRMEKYGVAFAAIQYALSASPSDAAENKGEQNGNL